MTTAFTIATLENIYNTVTITTTTNSTSTQTGALIVSGGVGIGGNLNVGGAITATSLTIQYTTVTQSLVTSPDIFTITNATVSLSTTTGALTVTGGVGIGGNLNVGGGFKTSGALTATNITNSGLSANQIVYAGTGGLLTGSSSFTYNGTVLQVGGTNPQLNVSVTSGVADTYTYFNNTNYYNYIYFQNSGTSYGSFQGAYGTGMFYNFDTQVWRNNAGTERMRVDSSGRLLIGTTAVTASSNELLEVYNGMTLLDYNSDSVGPLYIKNRSTTTNTLQPYVYFTDQGGNNRGGIAIRYTDASMHQYGQGSINWYTGSSGYSGLRMTLDSSGNLGLGIIPSSWNTVTPVFQIGGGASLYGYSSEVRLNTNYYYNSGDKYIANGYAASYNQVSGVHKWFTASNNSSGAGASMTWNQVMTLDTSGNLGLGATPSAWLWPDGSHGVFQLQANATLSGYNSTTYLAQNWYYNSGEKYIDNGYATRYQQTSGSHAWFYAGNNSSGAGAGLSWTQAMTLNNSGQLLLNGATAYQVLNVLGNNDGIGIQSSSGYTALVMRGNTENRIYGIGAVPTTFYANGSEAMRINSSGYVGIGTTSPGSILTISGNPSSATGGTNINGAVANYFSGQKGSSASTTVITVTVQEYVSGILNFTYAHTNDGDYGYFLSVFINNSYGTVRTQVIASKLTGSLGTVTTSTTSPGSGASGTYVITLPAGNGSPGVWACHWQGVGNSGNGVTFASSGG